MPASAPDPRTDLRLSPADLVVMGVVYAWPGLRLGRDDIGFAAVEYADSAVRLSLNLLVERTGLGKPVTFAAVGRLEDLGYLPDGAIR